MARRGSRTTPSDEEIVPTPLPQTRRHPVMLRLTLVCGLGATLALVTAEPAPARPGPAKLLIAFASYRERPLHPKVYFYEHDGVDSGKLVGSIDAVNQRSDYHPSLSHDGR